MAIRKKAAPVTSQATSEVSTKLETISPSKAAEYLKANTHNRALNDKKVDAYAATMTAGKWLPTHQGIAFSVDGLLVDGQHRLSAIVASGVTVEMLVTRGLPKESQLIIDRGAMRTVGQNVGLMGRKNAKNVTAWANVARFVVSNTQARYFDEAEINQIYDELAPAIDFASEPGMGLVARGPVGGAILISYNTAPLEVAAFFNAFVDGANLEKGSAVLAAWKFYFQGDAKNRDKRPDIAIKLLRCIQAHIEGKGVDPSHVYATQSAVTFFAQGHPPDTVLGKLFIEREARMARVAKRGADDE